MSTRSVPTLNDVWGSSASDVYAAGFTVEDTGEDFIVAGAIRHYDGTAWTSTNQGDRTLIGVWGSSPGDVFATGNDGTILHGGP